MSGHPEDVLAVTSAVRGGTTRHVTDGASDRPRIDQGGVDVGRWLRGRAEGAQAAPQRAEGAPQRAERLRVEGAGGAPRGSTSPAGAQGVIRGRGIGEAEACEEGKGEA